MFKYSFMIETSLLESLRSQKNPFKSSIQAKLVICTQFLCDVSFLEFLVLKMSSYQLYECIICSNTDLGSQQLCQSHFGSKIPILELNLGKTSYKDIVFARREFLSIVGAQNESLRLIIIYYIKKHIQDLNNFARFTSEPKNKSKGSIQAKLVTQTQFLREVTL